MNFLDWYRKWQPEITWWVIGWLCFATFDNIIHEQWLWACVNAGLIYLNFNFWKHR